MIKKKIDPKKERELQEFTAKVNKVLETIDRGMAAAAERRLDKWMIVKIKKGGDE